MHRSGMWVTGLIVLAAGAGRVDARERPIEQLPKDLIDLAFVWTEPIKQVAQHSRRFDPISGLWFGLVDGSVKSVERTAKFFFYPEGAQSKPTEPGKLFHYSF